MPRTGRGGKRTGRPGTAYSNRSDLTQAPSAAPNQEYGKAAEQMRAQRQVPLPKQAVPSPSSPAQAGSAPPVSPPGGAAPVMPGGLGPLTAMTNRPNEPLTAGMPFGPGAGPEALAAPDPLVKAAAVLNGLGHNADPYTARLRAMVNQHLLNQGVR